MAPDPRRSQTIADKLLKAEHPLLLAEYTGRKEGNFQNLVDLAETTGSGYGTSTTRSTSPTSIRSA